MARTTGDLRHGFVGRAKGFDPDRHGGMVSPWGVTVTGTSVEGDATTCEGAKSCSYRIWHDAFASESRTDEVNDRAEAGLGGRPRAVYRAAGIARPLGEVVLREPGRRIADHPVHHRVVAAERVVARGGQVRGDVAGRRTDVAAVGAGGDGDRLRGRALDGGEHEARDHGRRVAARDRRVGAEVAGLTGARLGEPG